MSSFLRFIALSVIAIITLGACGFEEDSQKSGESSIKATSKTPLEETFEASSEPSLSEEAIAESPSSEDAITPLYGDVHALVDAAVEGGYECASFKERRRPNWAETAAECNKESVFSTYATESDLEGQLQLWAELPTDTIVLVGEGWSIIESESKLTFLQGYLGGEIHYIYETE